MMLRELAEFQGSDINYISKFYILTNARNTFQKVVIYFWKLSISLVFDLYASH